MALWVGSGRRDVKKVEMETRAWPSAPAEELFERGKQSLLALPVKLRPFIVVSTWEEIDSLGAALVLPTSRWAPEDVGDAAAVQANRIRTHHYLPASARFRYMEACTVDFRWTYRLTRGQLALATGASHHPRPCDAKLREIGMTELLRRFQEYLSPA